MTPVITRDREYKFIDVNKIIKNENNPRSPAAFTEDELVSLRRSIANLGLISPVIVVPYDDDMYKLIEGERRWTSAKLEGFKEIPALVINRMTDHDEVVVMFNAHMQHRGWQTAEEMAAIKNLKEENGSLTDGELATELGMSNSKLRDRLRVLAMGDHVVSAIARGDIDFYVALRSGEVSQTLTRKRGAVVERLGGEAAVKEKLLKKAQTRKSGMTRELESIRQDASDTDHVPDAVLEAYIEEPEVTLVEARRRERSLHERRAVEDLAREVLHLEGDLKKFGIDLTTAPNLVQLRRALTRLIETATQLEADVVRVLAEAN